VEILLSIVLEPDYETQTPLVFEMGKNRSRMADRSLKTGYVPISYKQEHILRGLWLAASKISAVKVR
jgi:hypothetical protein